VSFADLKSQIRVHIKCTLPKLMRCLLKKSRRHWRAQYTWLKTAYMPAQSHTQMDAMNTEAEPTEHDFPHPHDWPLWARMQHAAQQALQRGAAQHLSSAPRKCHDLPVRHIAEQDFTTQRVLKELDLLTAAGGGQLYLPSGRLVFTESLHVPNHIHLIGTSGTELVFRTQTFGLIIQGQTQAPAQGICLENLQIRHIGEHRFSAAVFITEARELTLRQVHIHAPLAGGFLLADHVYHVRFNQCAVYHAGLTGFMLVRDVADCVLQACVAEYCMQGGIFITDLKRPPELDALDFDGQIHYTSQVIKNFAPFAATDPAPQRNSLINCTFAHNRKMGITTDGTGNLRVINCIIAENDCEGITLDNGTWNCELFNNHIYGNGWRGLQHDVELNEDFVEKMGLMPDGGSKAKLPGVSLDNAAFCRIENNLIEKNWGDGVKFVRAGYACTVANNLISHNNFGVNNQFHFFGVLVGVAERQHPDQSDFPSCHNRIINNDIVGAHYAGIHLLPGTFGNLLQGNRIIGATCLPIENHAGHSNQIQRYTDNLF